jgi:hypothetical protein
MVCALVCMAMFVLLLLGIIMISAELSIMITWVEGSVIPSFMLLTVIVLGAITILFLLDFILFLSFLKLIVFFFFWAYRLCAAAPFNILFFFFTLLLVSEQFILYFFYWCTFFSSRCSFPLTLYLHALFVGGSNSSVDFTGRDMIWMQLGHPSLIYK